MITYAKIAAACSANDRESERRGNQSVFMELNVQRRPVLDAAEQRWMRLDQQMLERVSPMVRAAIISMWIDGFMAGVRTSQEASK